MWTNEDPIVVVKSKKFSRVLKYTTDTEKIKKTTPTKKPAKKKVSTKKPAKKNSWGTQFGDKGYFYLSYKYDQFLDRWAILSIIGNTLLNETNFNKYLATQGLKVSLGMHASTARNMGFFPPGTKINDFPQQVA